MEGHEVTPTDLLGPLNEVEQKNAPPRLFVAGDVGVFKAGARVSIVGSRKASVLATIPIRVSGCGPRAVRAHHAARR
jgi:predicted Rossmann fold nucleotide-binding protein DprA/Smf involved in DNA uptake